MSEILVEILVEILATAIRVTGASVTVQRRSISTPRSTVCGISQC